MTGIGDGITIVGLGPGDPELRTVGTQRALDAADSIILRTRVHPGLDDLSSDPRVSDCDDLYRCADDFSRVYSAIAERVLARARAGGQVVYGVPGHPRFAEQSVPLIEAAALRAGVPVRVLDAVSFVDTVVNATRQDPVAHGLQVVDAEHLAGTLDSEPYAAGLLGIDPARPLLVAQVYSAATVAAVKLALSRIYPEDHPVWLVVAGGTSHHGTPAIVALHELDRQPVDHLTSVWLPPLPLLDAARSPETLARIVARLRAPGGCPWDQKQTHASLRGAILEEAYETVEAIDTADDVGLAEELGDLLLLVMMHAQLAEESGTFQIEDVYEAVNQKLIRRHPHVFGVVQAETPDAVVATWERVKADERAAKGELVASRDRFGQLPRAMPATRKVIELLAPRAELVPASDELAGRQLLDAVLALIDQGIDPEHALETALRRRDSELATGIAGAPDEKAEQGKEIA